MLVIFALLDPDPDSTTQINADPCGCGFGSTTQLKSSFGNSVELGKTARNKVLRSKYTRRISKRGLVEIRPQGLARLVEIRC